MRYSDEELYLRCGLEYIKSREHCPLMCNPEHTPLAKFVYGIMLRYTGLEGLRLFLFSIYISLILIIFILYKNKIIGLKYAFVSALLVELNPLILSLYSSALLDDVMLLFLAASFVLLSFGENPYLVVAALFFALSVMAKEASLVVLAVYALFVLVLWARRRESARVRRHTYFIVYTVIFIIILYTIFYSPCIASRGFSSTMHEILSGYRYEHHLHGFRLVISMISVSKMLTGVEVWKYYNVTFNIVNNTITIGSYRYAGYLLMFTPAEYSPVATVFPIAVIWLLLERPEKRRALMEDVSVMWATGGFVLGMLGPMAWYYAPYNVFATIALARHLPRRALLVLLVTEAAYLVWIIAFNHRLFYSLVI
ncbi:MAG: hypothetical protein GSR80_000265 [Desulfurococcales archaeon]|nr:hypothetical protein [Desulfurococcales archaeon]